MMKLRLVTTTVCLILGVLILALNSWAQERPPILDKVAKTSGVDSWNQIDAIRYTWHIEFGKFVLARSWEWEPKTTQVTYEGKDKDGKPLRSPTSALNWAASLTT